MTLGRRSLLTMAGCAALASAVPTRGKVRSAPHLLELFTSQGCSSCPPADALLARMAMRDDVLPLAFHVDYWNYLGWQDTFSSPRWTERQRRYAAALGAGVYSPQIVINGRAQGVGSNESQVEEFLQTLPPPAKMITATWREDALRVETDRLDRSATLQLVWFDRSRTVAVQRGENAGEMLRYAHVVRDIRPLAMVNSSASTIDVPAHELRDAGHEACALVLQEVYSDKLGRVLSTCMIGNIPV